MMLYVRVSPSGFQSSPDPKAGCDAPDQAGDSVLGAGVSILTRPEGRMRRLPPEQVLDKMVAFQSSPDPKAGCDLALGVELGFHLVVSILTRPEGRMRRQA